MEENQEVSLQEGADQQTDEEEAASSAAFEAMAAQAAKEEKKQGEQVFRFPTSARPEAILFDADHSLLAEVEEQKKDKEYSVQFMKGDHFEEDSHTQYK